MKVTLNRLLNEIVGMADDIRNTHEAMTKAIIELDKKIAIVEEIAKNNGDATADNVIEWNLN